MGVWTLLLTILGWILVCVAVLAAAILFAGAIVYVVQVIMAARARAKRKREPVTTLSDDAIRELAEAHIKSVSSIDIFGVNPTFMKGVEFALSAKRGDNADSV